MSLSKNNINKLKTFFNKNKENSNNDKISSEFPHDNFNENNKFERSKDPINSFYSLINNANTLEETSSHNQTLKDQERCFYKISNKDLNNKNNIPDKLTNEESLYNEFNLLLEDD